ncbi:zinc finger protein 134-like isoform X2 [Planococcus citri]|uniref:zinc finger protein 134-like isoform X2 n=1 Tax=Planococcus citri TaxID=170843 RepID=UPI0031F9758F
MVYRNLERNVATNFSEENFEQSMLGTSSDHIVTSNQFQNNILCKFENDDYPSDQENNEPYEIQSNTEEPFTKNEDLCVACGHVSAYEFFSFPIDADIRQQWAKFCDINLDEIKPHFRLCDGHFKPEDYQISMQRRVLMPTCVPTLDLKVKREARTDQRSVKDELLQSAEHVKADDVYTTDSSMPSVEISINNPQIKLEVKSEPFTEEVMLDEAAEKVAEDIHFVDSTISPREISIDLLHYAKANLKQVPMRVVNAETSRIVTGNNLHRLTTFSLENSNSEFCSSEDPLEQHFEEVTLPKPEYSDEDSQSPNSTIPSSEKSHESRNKAEARAGCSKNQENSGQGRITPSAKQKNPLPSVKKPTRKSSNVSNTVAARLRNLSPFPCDICGTTFSCKRDWTRHQHQHTKPFHCQVCDKQFAYKYHLLRHGLKHSEEKPFKCRTCDARFKHYHHKVAHERIHVEGACFECDECGKKFLHNCYLTTHMRVHSGVKPFSCQTCGKSFSLKHHLSRHQRSHSEDKPFKCRHCKQQFKHNYYKRKHERVHEEGGGFECAVCGKKFSYKHHLATHLRIHSGVKPFFCQTCSKSFTQKIHLIRHLGTHADKWVHVDEACFECAECGKSYPTKCLSLHT